VTKAEVQQVLDRLAGDVALTRAAAGLSLRALAHDSGVSYATLSRIERGETPDAATLIRLSRWLLMQAKRRGTKPGTAQECP
jgi:transcriptional regulator with XRE-family HTH domain